MSKPEETEKDILYVYAEEKNGQHIQKLADEYNLAKSVIVNKIIEGHRTGKKPKFEKFVPKYVQKAEKWENKNNTPKAD